MTEQEFKTQARAHYCKDQPLKHRAYWIDCLWLALTDKTLDVIPEDCWPSVVGCMLQFDLPRTMGVELKRLQAINNSAL